MRAGLNELFIEELAHMYNGEKQIVDALPGLITSATLPELKQALRNHLKETKGQVRRIEKIFSILKIKPKKVQCPALQGMIKETKELVNNKASSPVKDAAIIAEAQKIEHYEIATYGTLRSFAKHLQFDKQISNLIQESLNEEGSADKSLTKIAEGSFFSSGVNEEAVRMEAAPKAKKKAPVRKKAAAPAKRKPLRKAKKGTLRAGKSRKSSSVWKELTLALPQRKKSAQARKRA